MWGGGGVDEKKGGSAYMLHSCGPHIWAWVYLVDWALIC